MKPSTQHVYTTPLHSTPPPTELPVVRPLRYGVGPYRGHRGQKPGQDEADARCSLAVQRVSDHLPVVAAFDISSDLLQADDEAGEGRGGGEEGEESDVAMGIEVGENEQSAVCVVQ